MAATVKEMLRGAAVGAVSAATTVVAMAVAWTAIERRLSWRRRG